jgi:hypothetical protein
MRTRRRLEDRRNGRDFRVAISMARHPRLIVDMTTPRPYPAPRMKSYAVGLLAGLFMLSGCQPNASGVVRARFASDFGCTEGDVQVEPVPGSTYRATGCGQSNEDSLVYFPRCFARVHRSDRSACLYSTREPVPRWQI